MSNMEISIRFFEKENIFEIIPLLMSLNQEVDEKTLKNRVFEMSKQNYQCLGVYDSDKLIGICGLWTMTRHYCGKSLEPDHVIIDPDYRNRGIGKQLFDWIFKYALTEGFEASELNSYVRNTASHKFYQDLGYEIKGYHFVKTME